MNRRNRMLDALGIGTLWELRPIGASADARQAVAGVDAEGEPAAGSSETSRAADDPKAVARTAAMPAAAAAIGEFDAGKASDEAIAAMDWAQLQSAVAGCTRCGLCASRTRTVFGVGDPKAQWLFIGEGPGRSEDQQGEPFVGPAGKLLDNMLSAMQLQRGRNAFIANVVKCRPTDASGKDRAPSPEEAAACRPYLDRQIALIAPSMLIALGKVAATALLASGPSTTLAALRGKVHRAAALPVVVTYHPAYLLRVPADKRKTWEDLCLAMAEHEGHSANVEPG